MTLIESADKNPLRQLARWLDEAEAKGVKEPTAMALATSPRGGRPSVRVVLCKAVEGDGLVFYTNYESRKATEMDSYPFVSAAFHWVESGRQARVEGKVARTTRAESEAYFATRPRGSQLGAWASAQSRPLASYAELEAQFAEREREIGTGPVPCPPHWGGYRLTAQVVELWVAMPSRLHDRVLYTKTAAGWDGKQLAP